MLVRIAVAAAVVALTACGGAKSEPPPTQAAPPPPPAGPARPIVVDTDLGADDVIALAMLLRHPAVDVRAVTVSGTGLVHCPVGATHVRSILRELEVRDRPVGCGRTDAGPDGLSFPPPWRSSSDALYGLQLPAAMSGAAEDAATVLNAAITASASEVTVVALGPWTNLEDVVRRYPKAARRIAGIHAMAGAIDVPGNATAGAEWNVRADPSALDAVLRADLPVTLVPLDATNAVPLSSDFLDRLGEDHSAGAADLAWKLLSGNPFLLSGGQYLWDELAAIALVDKTLIRTERVQVQVDTAEPDAGRVARSDSGPELQVAVEADGARAVDAILEALRTEG